MNVLMLMTAGIMVAAMAGAWIVSEMRKPRHVFWAWDPGTNGVQPMRLTKLGGHVNVTRKGGEKVRFLMQPDFALPRLDGKGVCFIGDVSTGQLIRPKQDPEGVRWLPVHGAFMAAGFMDGRVQQLVAATQKAGFTLQHILIAVLVVGGLLGLLIVGVSKGFGF